MYVEVTVAVAAIAALLGANEFFEVAPMKDWTCEANYKYPTRHMATKTPYIYSEESVGENISPPSGNMHLYYILHIVTNTCMGWIDVN